MRIGLLTFHFADNYGALLQAFATVTFLKEYSHDVEVIDFIPQIQSNEIKFTLKSCLGLILRLWVWPSRKRRQRTFLRFRRGLPLTRRFFNLDEIDYSKFDCVITGSDQTFNLNYGFTDIYYQKEVKNVIKIAYAASFGSYDYHQLPANYLDALRQFDALSLREYQPAHYLSTEFNLHVMHVLDPVFLLDKSKWQEILEKPAEESFVFVYDLNGKDKLIQMAVEQNLNSKIIVFSNDPLWRFKSKFSQKVIFINDMSVERFLGYLNYASRVYTDSFHGFAFSVLFDKLLTLYIALPKASERIYSLLSMLKFPIASNNSVLELDTKQWKANIEPVVAYSKDFLISNLKTE